MLVYRFFSQKDYHTYYKHQKFDFLFRFNPDLSLGKKPTSAIPNFSWALPIPKQIFIDNGFILSEPSRTGHISAHYNGPQNKPHLLVPTIGAANKLIAAIDFQKYSAVFVQRPPIGT